MAKTLRVTTTDKDWGGGAKFYFKLYSETAATTDTSYQPKLSLYYCNEVSSFSYPNMQYTVTAKIGSKSYTSKTGSYSSSGLSEGEHLIAQWNTSTVTRIHSSQTFDLSVSVSLGDGDTLTGSGNIKISEKTSYTVKYNLNGGTGTAISSDTKWYGEALTLDKASGITKGGYTKQGWANSASATSAIYNLGGTYTDNADKTLYLVWKANTYTITYNANGGVNPPSAQTKTYDETLTLSKVAPTRAGYTFLGWSLSSTATTATWVAGASYTREGTNTLYAVWGANTYKITFDGNGGTESETIEGKYDSTGTFPNKDREYYELLGWADTAEATTATYNVGSTYTIGGNKTYYAVWKELYRVPTFTEFKVERCNVNGELDEEGTKASVTVSWYAPYAETNKVAIEVTDGTVTRQVVASTTEVSGTGTAQFLASDYDVDTTYTFTANAIVNGVVEHTETVELLSVSYYIDFLGEKLGVAIGKPATEPNVFDINLDTKIRKSLTAESTTTNNLTANSIKLTSASGAELGSFQESVAGTVDTDGETTLEVGNNLASGADGNAQGKVRVYDTTGKYCDLVTDTLSSNRTVKIQNANGIIKLEAEDSDTQRHFNIGTSLATGYLRFYNSNGKYISLVAQTPSNNRNLYLPYTTNNYYLQAAASSDVLLKDNIEESKFNALEVIDRIPIRQFDWKDSGKHWDVGMVAQEVEKIDENFIEYPRTYGENGQMEAPATINSFYLVGYLTKAVQELHAKVKELEAIMGKE
jgi:uncharacterized repeat protein (TIGR02543 family)